MPKHKLYTSFTSLWLKYIRAKSWWRTARPTFSSDLGQMSWHFPLQSDIEIQNVLLHHCTDAAKQTQTMTGWLCFTDGIRLLCWNAVFSSLLIEEMGVFIWAPKDAILVSSVNKTLFQKPSGMSVWSLANCWRAAVFSLQPCHAHHCCWVFPWWCQCERSIFYF